MPPESSPEQVNHQLTNGSSIYRVGGSLPVDAPTYVERSADRELFDRLMRRECCYVFNSRQMGKSSLRVRTIQKLEQAGVACETIDPQTIGTQLEQDQWYASVISSLVESFGLEDRFDLDSWWEAKSLLAPVKRLRDFLLQVLLVELDQPIVIFVEEIDSLLNLRFPADDFFLLIRSIYDQRSEVPSYNRLSFALVGVTTPRDLIKGHNHSAFNIGVAIEMSGFQETEVEPLARGLQGKVAEPEAVIREVLRWTGGQPFLTQKLLSLVAIAGGGDGAISEWVGQIVRSKIIHNWQIQDVPQHLKTLEERVLRLDERGRGQLLGMYQQVLDQETPPSPPSKGGDQETPPTPLTKGGFKFSSFPPLEKGGLGGVPADESYEQMLLRLTGLVVQRDGWLIPYNPIYAAIFNSAWIETALADLRPTFYAEAIEKWQDFQEKDESWLLRGQALQDAESWAEEKRLSEVDTRFLAASRKIEKVATRQANEILAAAREKAEAEEKQAKLRLAKIEKRTKRITLLGTIILTAILPVSIFFMLGVWEEVKQSRLDVQIGKINLSIFDTKSTFLEGKRLDALLKALKLRTQLELLGKESWSNDDIKTKVTLALQQAVYGVRERNSLQHKDIILSVAFSPDGKTIAAGGFDNTVTLWSVEGQKLKTLLGHTDIIRSIVFSPDGKTIASASNDKTVKLWNLDGQELQTFITHSDQFESVVFSPDGKTIASASNDKTVKLWNLKGQELQTFNHNDGVIPVAFSPDGKTIATGGRDGIVKLWNLEGKELQSFRGHKWLVTSLVFSPDGKIMATGGNDGNVVLWGLDGQEIETIFTKSQESHVAFSPDGKTIAYVSNEKNIEIVEINIAERKTKILTGHSDFINSIVFSPDGKTIATGSFDNTVRLWNLEGKELKFLTENKSTILSVTFSPDAQTIATVSSQKTAKLWNSDGKEISTFSSHTDSINSIAFSPDGKIIATGSNDKTAKLWDLDGKELKTLSGHTDSINSVAFSPDGKIIATGSHDKTVKLWNLDGKELKTLSGHTDRISSVAFSPDGKIIATGSYDTTVKLWNLDGRETLTFSGHRDSVSSVAFSPDSKTIISGSSATLNRKISTNQGSIPDNSNVPNEPTTNSMKLWTVEGKEIQTFTGHPYGVLGVTFSFDGKIIASRGAYDGTVKLWNLKGQELQTLNNFLSATFSSDGKTFATTTRSMSGVTLFNLDLDDLTARGCNWLRGYLTHNPNARPEDRQMCGIPPR